MQIWGGQGVEVGVGGGEVGGEGGGDGGGCEDEVEEGATDLRGELVRGGGEGG